MEQILISVLLLSAMGTLLAIVLMLIKPFTRRLFGSRWQYYIWLVVLAVLVLPARFDIPLQWRPIQQPDLSQTQSAPVQQEPLPMADASEQQAAPLQTPAGQPSAAAAAEPSISPLRILGWIWLAGALLFLGAGAVSYWRFLRTIRKSAMDTVCPMLETIRREKHIRQKIRLKTTAALTAPLMTGVFRPMLLLPDRELNHEELRYILLHELTHFQRRDLWYKWFSFLVNAVHWFNPVVYLVTKQIGEECEISCDLAVTRRMSEQEKKSYMATIVHMASNKKGGVKHVSKILYDSHVSAAQGAGKEV